MFMAVVAYYVTKAGQLGTSIDFCELEGEHSRANMAEALCGRL